MSLMHHLLFLVSEEDVILQLASCDVWECAGAWPAAGSDRFVNQYDTQADVRELRESRAVLAVLARREKCGGECSNEVYV
jgi:hypothetical protein